MKINYKRRKSGLKKVRSLLENPEHVWFIHYSCESFYNKEEPFSSRISAIAVRRLSDGLTHVYSISHEASFSKIKSPQINDKQYESLEKSLLKRFYQFIKQETYESSHVRTFIHWGMRSDEYGFSALEYRYRLLVGGKIYRVKDENKVDLSRLIEDIYGNDYIEKPCLNNLIEKNEFSKKDYLPGDQEALSFSSKEFSALHKSVYRKVSIFETILNAIDRGELKTNARWWHLHSGDIYHPFIWLTQNPAINACIALYALYEICTRIYNWFR